MSNEIRNLAQAARADAIRFEKLAIISHQRATELEALADKNERLLASISVKQENVKRSVGRPKGSRGTVKKGSSNVATLRDTIIALLKVNPDGLKLGQLTELILSSGYVSKSDNLRGIIYQTVHKMAKSEKMIIKRDKKYQLVA